MSRGGVGSFLSDKTCLLGFAQETPQFSPFARRNLPLEQGVEAGNKLGKENIPLVVLACLHQEASAHFAVPHRECMVETGEAVSEPSDADAVMAVPRIATGSSRSFQCRTAEPHRR
jgi:hypothetical protein